MGHTPRAEALVTDDVITTVAGEPEGRASSRGAQGRNRTADTGIFNPGPGAGRRSETIEKTWGSGTHRRGLERAVYQIPTKGRGSAEKRWQPMKTLGGGFWFAACQWVPS